MPDKEVKEGESNNTVNIVRIFDQQYSQIMEQIYKKVDVENDADEIVDVMGYLGKTKPYRPKRDLKDISFDEFYMILCKDNKLKEIMFAISQIDMTHDGYVTKNELDDILKDCYPNTLADRELGPNIGKFSSPQIKILIDCKKFRDAVLQAMAKNADKIGSNKDQLKK